MLDPFESSRDDITVHPPRKIPGAVAGLYKAEGRDFETTEVDELALTFDGIPGDYHAGHTRKTSGREPWYKRGTEIRNERQISLLCVGELRKIARRLEIPSLKPQWIGGNLLIEGINNFTRLPPRTCLFFEGGVTIRIDGDNAPCRASGRAIASRTEGREDIELAFAKQAKDLRGLVGWVEKEGTIKTGERFEARLPPQWIYTG